MGGRKVTDILGWRVLRRDILGALLALLSGVVPVQAALPVTGAAATADYWLRADGDEPLLSAEACAALTHANMQRGLIHDITTAEEFRAGDMVRAQIHAAAQGQDVALPALYESGQPLTEQRWREVCDSRAIEEIGAHVPVRPAVTVRRTDVRLLPSDAGWFSAPHDVRYDALQGTVTDPGEAVLVLHGSRDGRYAFVETRDYCGWVDERALAFTDRETWRGFAAPEEFFTVTTAHLRIAGEEQLLYQLGAKIPGRRSSDGAIHLSLPVRDAGGHLVVRKGRLPDDGRLVEGRLPLTHNNLVRLAFSSLYTEYGWGGANEGMDCSSYVQNIYRAMGVELPRDADMQERVRSLLPLAGLSTAERYERLAQVPPGALLFRPGHVMLYLGRDAGNTPLVIHDISSYYEDGVQQYIRQVVVSTLDFKNSRGTAAIDTLDGIGLIAPAP